jgi:hypothetical protein
MCTNAPAWFIDVVVKAMPNLTGVRAMPFLNSMLFSLKSLIASRRVR